MFTWPLGDDIELRLIEEHDAEAFFALVDRNRARLRRWLPWVDQTQSPEEVRSFIRTALQGFAENQALHAGVWTQGKLAGGIGHRSIDWANRSVSVGYWLDASFEGKGIMTRCCRAFVDRLFVWQKLHRVEIRCAPGNTRSCAIPERLGFTREGVAREAQFLNGEYQDLVVWSMLEDEWPTGGSTGRPAV